MYAAFLLYQGHDGDRATGFWMWEGYTSHEEAAHKYAGKPPEEQEWMDIRDELPAFLVDEPECEWINT